MFCAKCGTENDETAKFCVSCGYALSQSAQNAAAASDEEYYKAVIGPKHQEYYLRHFASFDERGKVSETWHWPSFFVTFYWLLYRKMWGNAILYFFLPYVFFALVGILGALAGSAGVILIAIGYLFYTAGIFIALPMYANGLYYKHCKKLIADVRVKTQDPQRQLGELSGKGGTSSVVIILLLLFSVVVGILAAIAIPAYSDYTTKARVAQAVVVGKNATGEVDSYYNQYRALPHNLEEAGFTDTLPPGVKDVSLNAENGIIFVTLAGTTVNGKTVQFVPSLDAGDRLVWTCMSDEIQDRYLPGECRQAK